MIAFGLMDATQLRMSFVAAARIRVETRAFARAMPGPP
jgi:hypothetical protein